MRDEPIQDFDEMLQEALYEIEQRKSLDRLDFYIVAAIMFVVLIVMIFIYSS